MSKRPSLINAYAAPLVIALVSIVGLVAALVADGLGDLTSWIALAAPVAVVVWAWLFRRG
ncbi:hypothetical protein P7B02_17785 [Caulobacter segnis]|uniref:hypothetical protein n=1 Tax=Caulobacter segnis TaxID=88688 RepID=UPI002410ABB0|nr:hypothetical protein [Caulobacter segnis]MDG2523383.1 hypothetical protein [Caulobacter segnis]